MISYFCLKSSGTFLHSAFTFLLDAISLRISCADMLNMSTLPGGWLFGRLAADRLLDDELDTELETELETELFAMLVLLKFR